MLPLIKFLESHPAISGYISIGSILIGQILNIGDPTEPRIPGWIMDSVQLVVWIIGGLVGLITVHGWYLKYIKKSKDNETNS